VNAVLAGDDADQQAFERYQETISSGELTESVAAFSGKRLPVFPWQ
jgi:hypothetical protein